MNVLAQSYKTIAFSPNTDYSQWAMHTYSCEAVQWEEGIALRGSRNWLRAGMGDVCCCRQVLCSSVGCCQVSDKYKRRQQECRGLRLTLTAKELAARCRLVRQPPWPLPVVAHSQCSTKNHDPLRTTPSVRQQGSWVKTPGKQSSFQAGVRI